jgi:hypothetical protein
MRLVFQHGGTSTVNGARSTISAVVLAAGVCCSGVCCSGASTAPAPPVTPAVPVAPLPVLTTMSVSISTPIVAAGQTATAIATGFDEKGRPMSIGVPAWTSSQPAVATVSAGGIVTAIATGEATLFARIFDVQGQATVVVTPRPPGPYPVATLIVTPLEATVQAGQSLQLAVRLKDVLGNDLDDRAVTWASSAPQVATVSSTGLVTTLSEGTSIVEATSEGKRGALALTVTAALDSAIVVSIAVPTGELAVGDSLWVVATARSPYPIVSVGARAGGLGASMVFGTLPGGRAPVWYVMMDLSLLRYGTYTLLVTATDGDGHIGQSSVAIARNPQILGGSHSPPAGKQLLPLVPSRIP